ncbi:hypothetical protein IT411_04220 [Candidatus Peregrinibacteria bacterium]|nr:hypothetical protein [Candidatus Peregrinibacteria bacterium]
MERKRKILAALADLKQEVAGPVPVGIIKSWQDSKRSAQAQSEILKPFEREGYFVTSDSSGLSRLTAERSLLEVMKMVSEPKEIIYNLGREIGGKGVGIWAADNTAMYYDASGVKAEQLVEKMAAAQKQIHSGPLQIGMGIHKGRFWELGNSLFGEEADLIENISEDFTEAKEIILSESVCKDLGGNWKDFLLHREDLADFKMPFYSLNYDNLGDSSGFDQKFLNEPSPEHFYPFPFSSDFFVALKKVRDFSSDQAVRSMDKFFRNKVVILIKTYHHKERFLLQELTEWVVVNAIWNEIVTKYDVEVVKSNGDLGIFVADKDSEAVEFAEDLLMSSRSVNDTVSIGLARGDVLLFNLDGGGKDIAGGAVNIASKISEDVPERNSLYIEASVEVPVNHASKYENFAIEKSKVIIGGLKFKK